MRASDADRDEVLERLRRAHVEGRLDHDELTDRAGAALAARTVGELTGLTADLPPADLPRPRAGTPAWAGGVGPAVVAPPGGHRANRAGLVLLIGICVTVGVAVLTGGHLVIWPGWLAFWVVLHLLRRARTRSGAPLDRPGPR